MIKAMVKRLGSLNAWLAKAGGYILLCMMLLTTCDVIGRYVFNSPITGAYEVTEVMMVTVIFLFLGYTQADKAHISIDLVVRLLPKKLRMTIDLITHLFSLFIIILIAWMNILRCLELMRRNEVTPILYIPVSPFLLILAIGCLVYSIELLKNIKNLFKHQEL
ncbi:MAG: TRAP transporter small permease [Deltaproteobacteria bacterium]|nr:MAG: TRAP transporter small permease [Deltaproteobacteria bacterium]